MDEISVAALLRDASAEVQVHDPPTAAIMRAGRRQAVRRRAGTGALTAAVASLLVTTVVVTRPGADPPPPKLPPAAGPVNTGCVGRPTPTLLPPWARAGFTDPEPQAPYVTGRGGEIVAILFTDALYAPPRPDVANKILWATPLPDDRSGPLTITARRDGTTETVTRGVPNGPGPSTVDLPKPGCWHLTLRWGQSTDVIDLRYLSP